MKLTYLLKSKFIYFLGFTICLSSCIMDEDIQFINKEDSIRLNNAKLELALVSKTTKKGTLKIKLGKELLGMKETSTHLDEQFEDYFLDLSKINDSQIQKAIENKQPLNLNLVYIDEVKELKVEDSIKVHIRKPPINSIINTDGPIYTPRPLSYHEILKYFSEEKMNTLGRPGAPEELITINNLKSKYVKVTVDTLYYKTIIVKYPIPFNSSNYKELDTEIQNYISTDFNNIKSDSIINLPNGKYSVMDDLETEYSGDIGVYLINFSENKDYFSQQVGIYRVDTSKPSFSQHFRTYPNEFNENPAIKGKVWLDTEYFYGHNPFTIPFVGMALGDISEIYVNNSKINFEIGESIFFKKKIYLDNGYNRIPVKIIDNNQNVTESYITVETKSMSMDSNK